MVNPFFKNTGPHDINYLLKAINLKIDGLTDDKIKDVKDLNSSQKNEITFFLSRLFPRISNHSISSATLSFAEKD